MPIRLFPLVFFLLLSTGPAALANMADPELPGDPVGEPSPLLDSIHILSENLSIDMRPLARRQACRVEATYHVRNAGSARTLDLVFIAGGLNDSAEAFSIVLDGRPMPGRFTDSFPVPISWQLPTHTPGFDGSDSIPYQVSMPGRAEGPEAQGPGGSTRHPLPLSASAILFSIHLPQGEHTITVTYDARAAGYPYDEIYVWQLGYVLSPARRWGSFGRLDARILLPDDWQAATTPGMKRSGDTLTGTWNSLPADAIAISTRMRVSDTAFWMADYVPIIAVILVVPILSFRLGWKKGRRLGMEGRSVAGAIPTALLCIFLSLCIAGAGLAAIDVWNSSLAGNQGIPRYSLLIFIPFILIGAFLTPYGLLLLFPAGMAMIAATIARSRALRINTDITPAEPAERI